MKNCLEKSLKIEVRVKFFLNTGNYESYVIPKKIKFLLDLKKLVTTYDENKIFNTIVASKAIF
jgi:hypothetical protein